MNSHNYSFMVKLHYYLTRIHCNVPYHMYLFAYPLFFTRRLMHEPDEGVWSVEEEMHLKRCLHEPKL